MQLVEDTIVSQGSFKNRHRGFFPLEDVKLLNNYTIYAQLYPNQIGNSTTNFIFGIDSLYRVLIIKPDPNRNSIKLQFQSWDGITYVENVSTDQLGTSELYILVAHSLSKTDDYGNFTLSAGSVSKEEKRIIFNSKMLKVSGAFTRFTDEDSDENRRIDILYKSDTVEDDNGAITPYKGEIRQMFIYPIDFGFVDGEEVIIPSLPTSFGINNNKDTVIKAEEFIYYLIKNREGKIWHTCSDEDKETAMAAAAAAAAANATASAAEEDTSDDDSSDP